jgi:hypothetical protein
LAVCQRPKPTDFAYRVQLKSSVRDPDAILLMNTVIGIMDIQVHLPMGACWPFGLYKRGIFYDRDHVAIDIESREKHLMRRSLIGRAIVSPHDE